MTGLYIVRGQGGSTGKTDKPEKVQLTTTSATLYSGNKTALEAFVTPWNLTDRSIVWSSSDEKIAHRQCKRRCHRSQRGHGSHHRRL